MTPNSRDNQTMEREGIASSVPIIGKRRSASLQRRVRRFPKSGIRGRAAVATGCTFCPGILPDFGKMVAVRAQFLFVSAHE